MYLIAVAWTYVVVLMALAEGLSAEGTWLGAFFTLLLYGALPLAITLYLMATPARRRARRFAATGLRASAPVGSDPDGGGHPAGDAVAPKREEA